MFDEETKFHQLNLKAEEKNNNFAAKSQKDNQLEVKEFAVGGVKPPALDAIEKGVILPIIINDLIYRSIEKVNGMHSKFVAIIRAAAYNKSASKFDAALKAIKINRKIPIDAVDTAGLNSLCYAAAMNHVELVKVLINSNADVNFKTQSERSWSILHFAAYYKNVEVVSILIDHGAYLTECGDDPRFKDCNPIAMVEKLKVKYIKDDLRLEIIEVLETAPVKPK